MKRMLWFAVAVSIAPAQESAFQEIRERGEKTAFQEALLIREVRESAAKDVGDALTKLEGLWRIRKGGIANDIVLRGFQQDNINVLVDGVRIYGACPNNMDPPSFHVDFAEVQEVEVTKGAFDIRNQGSLGGVVNVVNKLPEQGLRLTPYVGIGSFGYVNPSLTGSFANERWSVLGGQSYRRSSPYRDGRGVRFTERANYRTSALDANAFDVGTYWARFGAAVRGSDRLEFAYTRQNGDTMLYPYLLMDAVYDNADRASASYAAKRVRAQGYFTRVRHWMTDELRSSSAGAARAYGMATFAATKALGGKLETDLPRGITAGVEAYRRNWDAVNTMRMAGAYMDQHSIPNVDLTAAGAYVDWRGSIGARLRAGAGARIDTARSRAKGRANTDLYFAYTGSRDIDATDTLPSANLHAAYTLGRGVELFAGAGTSARLPDPQERYFALRRMGSDWVGNPALKPARNTEADAGITLRARRLYLRPTLFYSALSNYIAIHNRPRVNMAPGIMNTAARSFENVDARIYGGELSLSLGLTPRLLLLGGASYARGSKEPAPAQRIFDTALAEMPPLKARAGLRYGTKRFFGEFELLGANRQGRTDADLREDPTPGYAVVNVKAGVHTRRLNLSAGIENLLDRFYYESFSYQRDPFRLGAKVPEPGRSLFMTASFGF